MSTEPPLGHQASTADRPVHDYRSVSASISWDQTHRTTRLRPTATTFGWRAKLLLSTPPVLVFAFWAYAGAFNVGVIAIGLGLPMLWAIGWWFKQVWTPGRDSPTSSDTSQAPRPLPTPAPAQAVHPNLAYLHEQTSGEDLDTSP